MRKDGGHWQTTVSAFFVIEDTVQRVYVVWILMSIIGSLAPSWDGLTPTLEAHFPSLVPKRKILDPVSGPHTEIRCWEEKSCFGAPLAADAAGRRVLQCPSELRKG